MEFQVNGKKRQADVDPSTSLLIVLRDYLDLTGSKYGCGEGMCGACTVLINGSPVRSCITKAEAVAGKEITTIEGLAKEEKFHPVQQAFLDVDVFQCAYCASGMIMSSVALLHKNPAPNEDEIKNFMNGNVCRCGTYPRIVKAIMLASGDNDSGKR